MLRSHLSYIQYLDQIYARIDVALATSGLLGRN